MGQGIAMVVKSPPDSATPLNANQAPLAVHLSFTDRRSGWDLAAQTLFVVLALLILSTFMDYGVTWDEPVQQFYGGTIVSYYRSLLNGHLDTGAMNAGDLVYYGGFFDTMAVAVNSISPLGRYET